jgi:hypothetical protein
MVMGSSAADAARGALSSAATKMALPATDKIDRSMVALSLNGKEGVANAPDREIACPELVVTPNV